MSSPYCGIGVKRYSGTSRVEHVAEGADFIGPQRINPDDTLLEIQNTQGQWERLGSDMQQQLRGPKGSIATLRVRDVETGQIKEVQVRRHAYRLNDQGVPERLPDTHSCSADVACVSSHPKPRLADLGSITAPHFMSALANNTQLTLNT